jgi:hypothetical protein
VQTASVSNLQACTWYYFAAKVRSSSNEHSGLSRFRVKTLCGGGGGLSAVQVPGREGGVSAASFARQAAPASSVAPGSSLGWELRFEPAGEGLRLVVTRTAESPEAGAEVALEHLTTDGWQRVPSGSSFAGQDIAVMALKQNWRLVAPSSYTASGLAGAVGEAGNSAWVLSAAQHSAHGSLNPAAVELTALTAGDTLTLDYARGTASEAEPWFCLLDTEQARRRRAAAGRASTRRGLMRFASRCTRGSQRRAGGRRCCASICRRRWICGLRSSMCTDGGSGNSRAAGSTRVRMRSSGTGGT